MFARARMLAGQLLHAGRDSGSRRALVLSLRSATVRSAQVFQPYNDTDTDRYPQLFAFLASAEPDLRILSFGCSVGDELISLRSYFPAATIVGLNASAANVRECRRLIEADGLPGITVSHATDASAFRDQHFDLIFAMAVFRHGALSTSHAETCRPFLRFAQFERSIADLVRCLRVGGTLAVEHSNFRVADTGSAAQLSCVYSRPWDEDDARTPQFDRRDASSPRPIEHDVAFRRIG